MKQFERSARKQHSRLGHDSGAYLPATAHDPSTTTCDSDRSAEALAAVLAHTRSNTHEVQPLNESAVLGAKPEELRQLQVLGGVAAALGVAGGVNTTTWPDLVKKWMLEAPECPPEVINLVFDALKSDHDLLGRIYERIVNGKNRRRLGTFFTPVAALAYMRSVVDITPKTVVDPGAGVGAFATTALNEWPKAQVHAIDVNLVTLGLMAAHPALLQTAKSSGRLKLHHSDFIDWLKSEMPKLPGPRLIFGNPPYTRHQLLTAVEKEKLEPIRSRWHLGARAGLSTYFLAASLGALKDDDSLCLLLPANWLEADYARQIRQNLWNSGREVQIHMFPNDPTIAIFPTAQVAAMILWVGPKVGRSSLAYVPVSKSTGSPSYKAEPAIIADSSKVCPIIFTRETLEPEVKRPKSRRTVTLGELVTVRRGVATGDNKFFLRTDDDIKVNEYLRSLVIPAIARLREFEEIELDRKLYDELGAREERRWLLNLTLEDYQVPGVKELLESKDGKRASERHLSEARKLWYSVERISPPHILISPMTKETFRVVANSVGAIPTNTLYGMTLRSGVYDRTQVLRLVRWLRSTTGQKELRRNARRHGDGLQKLEPRALLETRVPVSLLTINDADGSLFSISGT